MARMRTVTLTTKAGEALDDRPWQAYPRPQLRRERWINLNGRWDYAESRSHPPACYDKTILVPFCPQSALSGIGHHPDERATPWLCYRTRFTLPALPEGQSLLLHCGGVDQTAVVVCNGKTQGRCTPLLEGGLTIRLDAVRPGENELCLFVQSDLRDKSIPYGKKTLRRGGMWYTPVSGIWQTVWLEWVPRAHITRLEITPGLAAARIRVWMTDPAHEAEYPAPEGSLLFAGKRWPLVNGETELRPAEPHLWTPEDPHLYAFCVQAGEDQAESYFALRTVAVQRIGGKLRIVLNGKPVFFHALLDQGYWPDGLYTPASPACYAEDILAAKALGFNTLRKHIKIEPEQFYYDCDRLGMLVFQDFVNNGSYHYIRDTVLPTLGLLHWPERLLMRTKLEKERFLSHMDATVRRLGNHPCVVYWTIFNEGWGQFDSSACYARLKRLDPTRIIDATSGWFFEGKTDVDSRHVYFKPFRVPKTDKPVILSEFGGYVCKLPAHSFNLDKTYGYKLFPDEKTMQAALIEKYETEILPAIPQGLCGAVWTQLTDVEDETNGLLTYDRRVCKPDPGPMQALAARLAAAIGG